MSLEGIGAGAGAGGFLGAVLTWLGFKSRVDRLEQHIDKLEDKFVLRRTCFAVHEAVHHRLNRMEQKLDEVVEYVRNNKKG